MLVAVKKLVRLKRLIDVVHQRGAFGIIKVLTLGQEARLVQDLLQKLVAILGIGDVAGFLVDLEMRLVQLGDQRVDLLIKIAAVLAGAGDDERRARLVDQNAVHLVDDGKEMPPLGHFLDRALHIVAQIVKAQLVVGGIGDVGAVGGALFGVALIGVDHPGRQTQLAVNLAHPIRIALGEVVVHRHDMHALAGQRIQIGREGRNQRLAFPRAHFGDVALMQENPALQLHIKGTQAKGTLGSFTAVGKGFGQDRVQRFAALLHTVLELTGLFDDPLIREGGEFGLKRVDLRHQRPHRFHLAIIRRAENLARKSPKTEHVISDWSLFPRIV